MFLVFYDTIILEHFERAEKYTTEYSFKRDT